MSATLESISLKVDTPTGGITPGRGFYQLEEDALYVQVGAYSKHQRFFNYLESDVVRFDIDKDGRLIFIEISMPRRHWEQGAQVNSPILADPADIRWLDFRTRIAEPKLITNENQTSLLIDFMSPHSWQWFTLAERIFVMTDYEHRLAAVMVTDIEDDLAGAQISAFRAQR